MRAPDLRDARGKEVNRAGYLVRKFLVACELAYRRSRKGTLPGWVAEVVVGACGEGELGGEVDFEAVRMVGFLGEGGPVVSGWEIGGGVPVLESRGWAALLRMRALREYWTLELRENRRLELEELLAWTWVVDPAPVPPHGVIAGLGIQDWGDAPREMGDGSGMALHLPDVGRGGGETVWGPDVGPDEWKGALIRAGEGFAEGRVATVQALPGRPDEAWRIL